MKLGRRLNIRQYALATAHVYLSRFLLKASVREVNLYLLVTTCVYLACKVEECPQYIRTLVSEARSLWPEFIPPDPTKVTEFEFYLLEELQCYLIVHHPYEAMEQIIEVLKTSDYNLTLSNEDIQNCWSLINDSYINDVHLIYPPHIIAMACMFITISLQNTNANNNNNSNSNHDNNNNNNNNSSSSNSNDENGKFSIEETINMNMRQLNRIVEEEEMKKRRRIINKDSYQGYGSNTMYGYKDIPTKTTIDNNNRNSQYSHAEKDNSNSYNDSNHSSILHLDPNVIAALNLEPKPQNNNNNININDNGNNHTANDNFNNATNIPLIFDFGDDYLEEEDEDYEEPDATSATVKDDDDDDDDDDEYEYEYEGRGENGDDFAELEELTIEHELQSLQNLGDEDLNVHPNLRH